jgi:hypothetical protein
MLSFSYPLRHPNSPYQAPAHSFRTSPHTVHSFRTSPLTAPVIYDEKGRQTVYVETPSQRRERLEFLKKRELARKIAHWVDLSSRDRSTVSLLVIIMTSPQAHTNAAGQSMVNLIPYMQETDGLPFIADQGESEPYIIYSSSAPTTALPSSLTPNTDGALSEKIKLSQRRSRRRGHKRHKRERSSLSSIREVVEED